MIAVTGRSGSGKSTLLNLISGIDAPDAGTVEFDGAAISAMAEPARTLFRRAHVGFIYQFFNLIPTLDVEENVRLVLELNGVRGREAQARSRRVLEEVGLAERAHSAVDQLSGVSSSGSRSRAPWCTRRRCCSPMNPPATWTRPPRARSSPCCCRSPGPRSRSSS